MAETNDERLARLEARVVAITELAQAEREADRRTLETALQGSEKVTDKTAEQLQRVVDRMAEAVSRHEFDGALTALRTEFGAGVDKNEVRLRSLEDAVAEVKVQTVPRGEIRVLLDNVQSRQESVAKSVTELANVLTAMRSELAGQETEERDRNDQANRNRNLLLGAVASAAAVVGASVAVITQLVH